jgi:hypothetical protein
MMSFMDPDRRLARVALSLVEGMVRGDPSTDPLLVEAFTGLEEAARAHAYLCGFLLQLLAHERGESVGGRACTSETRSGDPHDRRDQRDLTSHETLIRSASEHQV